MQTIRKLLYSTLAVVLFWVWGFGVSLAGTPSLQVTTSDNQNYQITVSGANPYSIVDFYTRQSDTQMWTTYSNIGTTDANGYYSGRLNITSYNPGLQRESYVNVSALLSSVVNTNSGSYGYGAITFGQTNPTLSVGQSLSVPLYGAGGQNYYISNNSNSYVVSASISGSTLSLYGNSTGNSSIVVCSNYVYYNSAPCGTLYVTVSGSTSSGNVWFSPSNPVLYVGQSLAVSINSASQNYSTPYSGNAYYVVSNSNPGVVSASVSGTVLNLYAYSNGTSSIVINHSSLGWSGTLFVTVGTGSGGTTSTITFSNTNPNLSVGASLSISVYTQNNYNSGSYYNNFYVASNSNQSVVSTTLSGQTLTLYGLANGSSTIMVCQNNTSNCGSVYVSVGGYIYGANAYANGQLLNESGTVCIVYKNSMLGFTNADAFLGLGYEFGDVTNVGHVNMPMSSNLITTQYGPHPWGSWVRSGHTVYFIHENGLIPVPSYDVFLNNGGQDRFVVPMNSYDWQKIQLPVMTYSDSRLR